MLKADQSKHTNTNQRLKVATLNVRGLTGDSAYVKKSLIVDIMEKWKYDLVLLQETKGCSFSSARMYLQEMQYRLSEQELELWFMM